MIRLYKVEGLDNKVTAMGVEFAMDLFLNTDHDKGPYVNYVFDREAYLGIEADESMHPTIVGFLEHIGVTVNEVNFREEHS